MNPTGNQQNPPLTSPNAMAQGHGRFLRGHPEGSYNMQFYGPAHINMFVYGQPGNYSVTTSGGNMSRTTGFGNQSRAVQFQTPPANVGQGVTGQFNGAAGAPRMPLVSTPYPDRSLNRSGAHSLLGKSYSEPSKLPTLLELSNDSS